MTPDEIRNATIRRTGIGRRGYHEGDVDEVLIRVADDVEGWVAENASLRAENERLRVALRARLDQPAAPTPRDQDPVRLLSTVQEQTSELAQRPGYHYDGALRAALDQANEEAQLAVHDYRFRAGDRYSAGFEELERRLAWARVFLGAIQVMDSELEAAHDTSQWDVELGGLDWGPERFT